MASIHEFTYPKSLLLGLSPIAQGSNFRPITHDFSLGWVNFQCLGQTECSTVHKNGPFQPTVNAALVRN